MLRLLIIMCAIILTGIACTSTTPADTTSLPAVIFEVEHINYAWGYTHYGIYIDNAGNVYHYDRKRQPWKYNAQTVFSELELLDKFSIEKTVLQTLSINDIQQRYTTARRSDVAMLNKPEYRCADAGVTSFWVYEWNTETKRYSRTLLTSAGDVTRKNQNRDGQELVQWLRSLDSTFTTLPCFE